MYNVNWKSCGCGYLSNNNNYLLIIATEVFFNFKYFSQNGNFGGDSADEALNVYFPN